jgi:Secretion system C-terminal sorting domain
MKCLLYMPVLFISISITSQVRWNGNAGDGQWTTPANWVGNQLPSTTDDVLLDNSVVAGNYMVSLPGAASAVTIKSIVIAPATGNTIQLTLPVSNTATPAFTLTGPGYCIMINKGGIMINSSGASGNAAITVNDSVKINNGGMYTHNTRSAHAALVTLLSKAPGTEKGIFKFDVPGGGYTFASTNRTYGTLILSADASGGSQAYASSAASPLNINGDCIIQAGVTVNLDITAATTIKGNYIQQGGVFNLASQPNNNIVYIKGDLMQTAGTITETSTGLPVIELNGNSNQNIQAAGSITNSVGVSINNNTGVTLLAGLSLPYKLNLVKGIVNTQSFLVTLFAGCSIQADSTNSASFINGALRKEGLLAASHFLFPVGKNTTQRWAALKNVTGNYTVEFIKSNPNTLAAVTGAGIHHISSIEYWSIIADPVPAPAAQVELSFNNVNSGGVTDMVTLRVAQLFTGIWTDKGNMATNGTPGSAGSVISNPLNVFGQTGDYFTLASSNAFQNPLPLKLISFGGHLYNNAVALSWMIELSWQPAYFELQSSEDGIHFIAVSKIDTVNNQSAYQYTDKRKLTGKEYYRLKNIEKDGSFFYSSSIQITPDGNLFNVIQLRPSVVKTNTLFFISTASSKQVAINIYNADGKMIDTRTVFLQTGINSIPLQLQALAAGVYIITVNAADNKTQYTRFIKFN